MPALGGHMGYHATVNLFPDPSAGTNPQTHQKFRQAHEAEPALYQGTWMTRELQAFLGKALEAVSAGEA